MVKASTETDADAADRSSDAIRVDANELRCRVVGEGGNLGFTRRARVEFAAARRAHQRRLHRQLGRRRLLRPRGQPEDPARPGRAARRADPRRARRAAARGHRGRRRRTSSTTRSCRRRSSPRRSSARPARMFAYEDLMALLEERRLLDRASRGPADRRGDRPSAGAPGAGMERPELAVLARLRQAAAGAARSRTRTSSRSRWLERDLREYFPPAVVERFGAPAGRAPAAPRADLHGQRQRGRQRARADLRLALVAERGAEAGRRRARLPDRARGDRRRRALGGGRAPRAASTAASSWS